MQERHLHNGYTDLFDQRWAYLYFDLSDLHGGGKLYSVQHNDMYTNRPLYFLYATGKRNQHLWTTTSLLATSNAHDQ